MARSWLEKLLLWPWWSQPSCCRTLAWLGSRSRTRWYAAFGAVKLWKRAGLATATGRWGRARAAYIFLLFVDVADLETRCPPRSGEAAARLTMYLKHCGGASASGPCHVRAGGGGYLEALAVLLLLFVDYTQAEVYLVGLFKVGLHLHDLGEGLLGVSSEP